ncbi:hypothetical protein ANN_08334 [Periplaneta americana]|uniref:Uncharacterized protein n=1 Tax=Periplaneta americana TaxID=6978 RepID=A0ABQ8T299_PERAM|nr:hypothetical protein ANN_08334 [Periplaneta americana]
MIMSRDQIIVRNGNINIGNLSFEEVEKFNFPGATVTNINDTREEIKRRINMGNAYYYSVEKLLSSSLLSKRLKTRIYKTVVLPVVLYGYETWTLILRQKQRLRVFENKKSSDRYHEQHIRYLTVYKPDWDDRSKEIIRVVLKLKKHTERLVGYINFIIGTHGQESNPVCECQELRDGQHTSEVLVIVMHAKSLEDKEQYAVHVVNTQFIISVSYNIIVNSLYKTDTENSMNLERVLLSALLYHTKSCWSGDHTIQCRHYIVEGEKENGQFQIGYLRCTLSSNMSCCQEVKRRIAMVKEAFNRKRNIICEPLEKELRKTIVKSFVLRVALFEKETWTLRRSEEKRLEALIWNVDMEKNGACEMEK